MPEQANHPSPAKLHAYGIGQLPLGEASVIEKHISECEPCCETIADLSSDDTFIGLLQSTTQKPTDQTVAFPSGESSHSQEGVPAPLAQHPRYEIIGLIGKGGMGDVYKAQHRKMKRIVALKVINHKMFRQPEAVSRFHREVEAAAQLSHQHIVTSHDADQAGDFHFMVMECVDGVDLSQVVRDRGALPIDEACEYIRQAALGLQHAHERGMVHRDIKPHNLMVTADNVVKILDFGLASLAPEPLTDSEMVEPRGDLTVAGSIMGTPDFISPEQAMDARQADIRSDIYSLGQTLYFLLSGRPPFVDGSVMHKLKSHAQIEPEPLKTLRDDVPDELAAVVKKMTAKDPDERYLTPREVADALEKFLQAWQPEETNSLAEATSGGGAGSGSDGQKPATGDEGSDGLSVAARWLFYTAWIPIALLVGEVLLLDTTSDTSTTRIMFYVGTAICLSTIAAALSAGRRFQTEMSQTDRGDRRIFRMTSSEAMLVAGILIAALFVGVAWFMPADHGAVRIEVAAPEHRATLGTHDLTIVDTSGKPFGGTSGTHQDDGAGITTHFFNSANGRYEIELVNEVMTINGEKYTLKNQSDSIRITDDRVEITERAELTPGS